MNMSQCISAIINQLGLYQVNLPFNEPTDQVIHNVLKTTTIPIYSQFQPWQRQETVNLNHLKQVNVNQNIYLLPDSLSDPPIISILDVHLPIEVNRGMFGDIGTPFGAARTMHGVLQHQAFSMAMSQARSEPTFEFIEPNKIRLYGFPKTWVNINTASQHMENGETIPATCYDSFMQLALLDVRMFMYNNLKMYDNIPTAFGNISLKLEDHHAAEDRRETLLEQWRDTFHLDMPSMWTYM